MTDADGLDGVAGGNPALSGWHITLLIVGSAGGACALNPACNSGGSAIEKTLRDLLAKANGTSTTPSILQPTTDNQNAGKGSTVLWLKKEIKIGKIRINPNGDKTSANPNGRKPRRTDPNGDTLPGQGIGRHRPWDTRSTDKSFWDRF